MSSEIVFIEELSIGNESVDVVYFGLADMCFRERKVITVSRNTAIKGEIIVVDLAKMILVGCYLDVVVIAVSSCFVACKPVIIMDGVSR